MCVVERELLLGGNVNGWCKAPNVKANILTWIRVFNLIISLSSSETGVKVSIYHSEVI